MAYLGRTFGLRPVVDGETIPVPTAHANFADETQAPRLFLGMRLRRRILIGDCQLDVGMLGWSLMIYQG